MEENKQPNEQEDPKGSEQNQEGNPDSRIDPPSEDLSQKDAGTDSSEDITSSMSKSTYVDVSLVSSSVENIKREISKVIIGQENLIELLMTGLFVGGHCLIEGLPGIGKTLTAKLLSQSISASFSRLQFTPDLMPTDITGTSVFNVKEGEFYFKKGPVFANIVLIDEINRAPAKTQAALMEVMEERQITYDGTTYPMGSPFFVVATQNPIEQEGTYNLPEAQLDRFIFKINVGYPDLEEEKKILHLFQSDFSMRISDEVKTVLAPEQIKACTDIVEKVHIKKDLLDYIAAVVHNTRNNGDLYLGASPRASLSIMRSSKAIAAIRGRDFVTPDDIKHVAIPVLNHRVIISHEREMEGTTVNEIIDNILDIVEIPR
jgi:MoxR-like ATPase